MLNLDLGVAWSIGMTFMIAVAPFGSVGRFQCFALPHDGDRAGFEFDFKTSPKADFAEPSDERDSLFNS
jgi:hypothetical protein